VYVALRGDRLSLADLQSVISDAAAQDRSAQNWLVIDEADRAEPVALAAMVRQAIAEYARVLLLTRESPAALLEDDALRSAATFVPASPISMLTDYAALPVDGRVLLEVRAFGTGRIFINGYELRNWEGHLPRALFFYIVDRGMATRTAIFEEFWPELSLKEATNVFHVTKRKVNEILGFNLTVYDGGFYRLADEVSLRYDVGAFHDLVQFGTVSPPEQAYGYLDLALDLARGEFLATQETEWRQGRAEALRMEVADALVLQARCAEALGWHERALTNYAEAYLRQPLREDIVAHMLQLSVDHGWSNGALTAYERLARELQARYAMAPAAEVQALAAQLRQAAETH
jgi:DNA-binding SARP family transcriptional activator